MTSASDALLDVNVLVALAWPSHTGHRVAREWFDQNAASGWATTPATEAGFVRVSSNRSALPESTTPRTAISLLARLRLLGQHAFWVDDVELVTGSHVDSSHLTGHRQVTDAHLLALCASRSGRLVTFDAALAGLDADADLVELLTA